MCGIVGAIGLKEPRGYTLRGLKTLDYRGYDSAGVAFFDNGLKIIKDVGSVEHLMDIVPNKIKSNIMIGHTRWATHGVPNKENTHPHLSNHKAICLVHNGVIENFMELKKFLLEKGYEFYGDTDSEIVANLIEYHYLENKDVLKSIKEVMDLLKGNYAFVVFTPDDTNHLYVMKKGSPLIVGKGNNFNLVASDASPMIELTNTFIELDDNEYGVLSNKDATIYNQAGEVVSKEYIHKDIEAISHDLKGYPHYMLKEIEEIEPTVERIIDTYYVDDEFQFDPNLVKSLKESDHIIFIACGTSYHASLVGGRYFEDAGQSASRFIASEWAFHPTFPGQKPFIILISQSGETADLIHCLKLIKEHNLNCLVITNTGGSTLDRNCQYSLLLHAGIEVSVASTKAYVAQTALLALLAASLKLKEVSYIHSEAVPGGELKHGPIALIEEGTPVIVFITDPETASSMRGNIEEVRARGAIIYEISTKFLAKEEDNIVVNDYAYYLSSVAISSVAFYLAYYVSLAKGLNVDKPRNLAKSVTVE